MTLYVEKISVVDPSRLGRMYVRPNFWEDVVELRRAERDVAGSNQPNAQFMTVWSAKLADGTYWAMLSTDGMWRVRDEHAF